jgi:hypothetical protein
MKPGENPPQRWQKKVGEAVRARPNMLSSADLLEIGRSALWDKTREAAYLATAAGLSQEISPLFTARFLLLRSQTLPEYFQLARVVQCLHAALALARQCHAEELIKGVFEVIDRHKHSRVILRAINDATVATEQRLRDALNLEKRANKYPANSGVDDPFVGNATANLVRTFTRFGGIGDFRSRFDLGGDGFQDDYDGEDDDDDDDHDDENVFFGEDDSVDDDGGDELGSLFPPNAGKSRATGSPSPESLEQLKQVFGKTDDASLEQLMNDPTNIIMAMAAAMGQAVTPEQIQAMRAELGSLMPGGGEQVPKKSQKGSNDQKKRRK